MAVPNHVTRNRRLCSRRQQLMRHPSASRASRATSEFNQINYVHMSHATSRLAALHSRPIPIRRPPSPVLHSTDRRRRPVRKPTVTLLRRLDRKYSRPRKKLVFGFPLQHLTCEVMCSLNMRRRIHNENKNTYRL